MTYLHEKGKKCAKYAGWPDARQAPRVPELNQPARRYSASFGVIVEVIGSDNNVQRMRQGCVPGVKALYLRATS